MTEPTNTNTIDTDNVGSVSIPIKENALDQIVEHSSKSEIPDQDTILNTESNQSNSKDTNEKDLANDQVPDNSQKEFKESTFPEINEPVPDEKDSSGTSDRFGEENKEKEKEKPESEELSEKTTPRTTQDSRSGNKEKDEHSGNDISSTQENISSDTKNDIKVGKESSTDEDESNEKDEVDPRERTFSISVVNKTTRSLIEETKEEVLMQGMLKSGDGKAVRAECTKSWFVWQENKAKTKVVIHWNAVITVTQSNPSSFTLVCLPVKLRNANSSITNRETSTGDDSKLPLFPPKVKRIRRDITFTCDNADQATSWIQIMKALATPHGERSLLIFVNPFSGKKHAKKIFHDISPLFPLARIKTEVIVTQHRFHAMETVSTMKLEGIHGIVTVGGDGLLWEVINGLMKREDWEKAIKLPLGVIPAGTGNALASSLGAYGDPLTAVLYIIKGFTRSLDLWRVDQRSEKPSLNTIWSFLSICWGILSDVDIESERFRWMGDLRYTLGGLAGIMAFRKYKGKLWIMPGSKDYSNRTTTTTTTTTSRSSSSSNSSSSNNNNSSSPVNIINSSTSSSSQSSTPSSVDKLSKDKEPDHSEDHENHSKLEDKGKTLESPGNEGPIESERIRFGPPSILDTIDISNPPKNWTAIEDDFLYFLASNLSHLTIDLVGAPRAEFDDGFIDLITSRDALAKVSKLTMIKLFDQMNTGNYVNHSGIEYLKTKAFIFEPGTEVNSKKLSVRKGFLTIDGENAEYTLTAVECFQGLANVFCAPPRTNLDFLKNSKKKH